MDTYKYDPTEREADMALLKKYVKRFKDEGFFVGAWVWTFWINGDVPFERITGENGAKSKMMCCPADEEFIKFAGGYIQDIARCGVDAIQFDDDFRFGHLDVFMGCVCDKHIAMMSEILGEPISREGLIEKVLCGGKNKYRSAWMKANSESMYNFARKMRESLNEVDASIRLGFCSCMSNYDNDGTDPVEMAKALAGDTKPFMRLIGATYWACEKSYGQDLRGVIETERMELSWCRGRGVDIICEGDGYPHISYYCKVNHLESFDLAMRADGTANGILKYMITYYTTYKRYNAMIEKHKESLKLYADVSRIFSDKTAKGVKIYEFQHKLENMDLPENYIDRDKITNLIFSDCARAISILSFPTTYEGDDCIGAAFGENAKYLTEENLKNGMLLDITAAKILEKRGIDVGLEKVGESISPVEEYYVTEEDWGKCYGRVAAFDITPKQGANVESYYIMGKTRTPAAYTYENKDGQRFFVLAVDAFYSDAGPFKHILRQEQILRCIEFLQKKPLSAMCAGNPDLYTICKTNGSETAVGLWNMSDDGIDKPEIVFDGEIKSVEFINCTGSFEGNTVTLSPMVPKNFAFINVTKK